MTRWPPLDAEHRDAVSRVLTDGPLVDGPETEALEREWAHAVGARHCVALSNCTAGIQALLHAVRADRRRVVVPAVSFPATLLAARHVARDVYVADVDPTGNIDLNLLRPERGDLVLPVHLHGVPVDLYRLSELRRAGVVVVEDACQAAGAEWNGLPVGMFGHQAWSTSPTKPTPAPDGGLVTTDDEAIADQVRRLRDFGRDGGQVVDERGHNWRMSEPTAAIIRIQLARLPRVVDRAVQNAALVTNTVDELDGLTAPDPPAAARPSWHKYRLRCPDRDRRDRLAQALTARGVPHHLWERVPMSRHPAWRHLPAEDGEAEAICDDSLLLGSESDPLHAWTFDDTAERCDALRHAWKETA